MISFAVSSSRFPVGSSAISKSTLQDSARAIATRCCCPPLSCKTFRLASTSVIPTLSNNSNALAFYFVPSHRNFHCC